MSINNKRSYTEYTVVQPTTDFAIGFDDFDEGGKDNILVTLNGVLVESLGYAAIRKNESTVTITPAITEGTVRLTRETDIDEPFHKFTAGALFSAKSMDENFQQVRHSQQEVRDGFVFLEYNTNGIVQASKEATAQAKAATVEATASAVRAESAADTAVQAVGSLQSVVNAATTATTNANAATATATTAASQATAATTSAQNAAQAANTAKQEATAAAAIAKAATVDTLAATGRANSAADVVADLVVGKVRAQDVSTELGLSQKDLNYGVDSVAVLTSLTSPVDGVVVNTASYLAGKKVGGNTYRYNSARASENDSGSIINGWVVVGKTEFTPEDFGALPSVETLDNDAALRKFILSGLNLVVPDNTTYSFSTINSFDITKPLFLKGGGMYSSSIKRLSLYFETDDSKVTDVGLHTLVPQYTCYIRKGSRNVFTRVYTYHNYDGFAIYRKAGLPESEKLSGNQFIDCVSEKSGRVGFTVDIGAYETLVDGCRAIDCRQAFHVEGAETTWINRGVSERCGLLAAFNTGENVGYEGSIRSYGVKGLYVNGFENINPNGRCQWQHGAASIGSSDLVFKNMKGTGGLGLDDEIGVTTNLTVQNVDDFGVYQNNLGQRLNGTLRVEDSGNFTSVAQFGTTSCDLIVFRNTKLGLTAIETIQADGTIILDNASFAHSRGCVFGAAHIQITNGIANNQLSQSDPDFFQGLRFDAVRLKTFFCDVIRLTGAGTGTHLSFYNAASPVQAGKIGSIVADIPYTIGWNAYKAAGYDAFTLLGISFDNRKFNRLDAIPTSGTWSVGDTVYKNSVIADTIYGWVCTTAGTGAAAVWQPLKYSV